MPIPDPAFRDLLRCPAHPNAGFLTEHGQRLRCQHCGKWFLVVDGIPDMLVGEGAETFRERERAQWDEQAARYDEKRMMDLIYQAAVDAAVEGLRPREADLVLDAGCGTGMTVKGYSRQGCRIVALDLSRKSLEHLRRTGGDSSTRYIQGDVLALPFPLSAFDKVLCANTLTQIPGAESRRTCLRELARVARPAGRIVVTAHNFSIPKKRAGWKKEGAAKAYADPVQFIYRYDLEEFRADLNAVMDVERIHGAGLPLPYRFKLTPLSRWLERRLWHWRASAYWGNMLVGIGRKPS